MSAQISGLYVNLSPIHLEPGMFIHSIWCGWQEVKSVEHAGQGHVYVEVSSGWITGAVYVRFDRVAVQLSGPLEGTCWRCNWLERYCRCHHHRETCSGVWPVGNEFWFCAYCYPLTWDDALTGPQKQLPAECATTSEAMGQMRHLWTSLRDRTPDIWDIVAFNNAAIALLAVEWPGCQYFHHDEFAHNPIWL